MAISIAGFSTAAAGGTGQVVLSVPAIALPGDVLLASFPTVSGTPAGWVTRVASTSTNLVATINTRTVTGTETPTYTWPTLNPSCGCMLVLRGIEQTIPIDGQGTTAIGTTSTSMAAAAVNSTFPDALFIYFAWIYRVGVAPTVTPPAAMTEQVEFSDASGGNSRVVYVATQPLVVPGNLGAKTATLNTASTNWMCMQISFREAIKTYKNKARSPNLSARRSASF